MVCCCLRRCRCVVVVVVVSDVGWQNTTPPLRRCAARLLVYVVGTSARRQPPQAALTYTHTHTHTQMFALSLQQQRGLTHTGAARMGRRIPRTLSTEMHQSDPFLASCFTPSYDYPSLWRVCGARRGAANRDTHNPINALLRQMATLLCAALLVRFAYRFFPSVLPLSTSPPSKATPAETRFHTNGVV